MKGLLEGDFEQRAEAYADQGELHTAIQVYQEAVGNKANGAGLHYNLGRAYQLLGEYPLAVESFLTAIRMDRAFMQPYINLGGVYYQMNRHAEAEEVWRQALRLQPENQTVQDNLDILKRESQ